MIAYLPPYFILLLGMVSWMKMSLDFKQVDHYFYLWEAENDRTIDLLKQRVIDREECEDLINMQYASYKAHRKACYGF